MVMKNKKHKNSKKTCENVEKSTGNYHDFMEEEVGQIREKLLSWYDGNQREMPWRSLARKEADPDRRAYLVWVSEVMLQQTQVSTVIPYFNRWMERWPTVQALAQAPLEEVHQTWAGLGYYSRATRLLQGAQKVAQEGHFPTDLSQLPGVGRYTAAAVASIAMGQCCGVVDGNVIRVLTRLRVVGANTGLPGTVDLLWKMADKLVATDRPGDFNQALMELGAVVCTPKSPSCSHCPLQFACRAHQQSQRYERSHQTILSPAPDIEDIGCKTEGCTLCLPKDILDHGRAEVTLYPHKQAKKPPREEQVAVLILQHQDTEGTRRYLMGRRPSGLLCNLWEFPNCVVGGGADISPLPCSAAAVSIGEVLHVFSHIRTTYQVKWAETPTLQAVAEDQRWMTEEDITTGAVSTAMKKVFHLFLTHNTPKEAEGKKKNLKRKNEGSSSNQPQIKHFFKKQT